MTTARVLLAELTARGISVRVVADDLRLRPSVKVTPDLLDRIRPYRHQIAQTVRTNRLLALTDDQLDAWAERLAICIVDGGLSEADAEEVAWREMECCEYDKKSENRLHTDSGKR